MSSSLSAVVALRQRLVRRFAAARSAVRRAGLARLSFRAVERGALMEWLIRGAFNGRVRAIGVARYEAGRIDVALTRRDALRTMSADVREAWIDERFYAAHERGRDPSPELRVLAAQVVARIREMRTREPTRPVILSPFHYLSQYANICVVEHVRRGLGLDSISLVSGVPRDIYGDDAAMIPAIRVLHTHGESTGERNALGLRVVRALRREGVAVLFADVPPFTLARYPMETVGVTLRGRRARVHAGVFRLGAPLDAYLLPFYLRLDRGRFGLRIFEPIELANAEAPQRLADDIDTACQENYPHWLYAGHPCVYHFAPTR
jgi:hypothetical protein